MAISIYTELSTTIGAEQTAWQPSPTLLVIYSGVASLGFLTPAQIDTCHCVGVKDKPQPPPVTNKYSDINVNVNVNMETERAGLLMAPIGGFWGYLCWTPEKPTAPLHVPSLHLRATDHREPSVSVPPSQGPRYSLPLSWNPMSVCTVLQ